MSTNSTLLTALALFFTTSIFSQQIIESTQRYIAVTGSAEVIVQPDEIELEIELMEYTKLKVRYSLPRIEEKFKEILVKHKISTDKLEFANSQFYWYHWWKYRNRSYNEKTYKIKLSCETDFLALVKDLDFPGVNSLRISDSSNSQLQEMRRDIKISAIKAAKEKAAYLLASIDEKVGKVISIDEMPDNYNNYWRRNQNLLSNVAMSASPSDSEIDNVASIKLRYEIKAKFSIE